MNTAPKLHFVTGKGGVGKTSVACALALRYAQAGKRVLLAELNGGDRVACALQVEPVGYALREVVPNLWAIDLTPEASLREYVLLTIRVQAIYRAIFEGRLVASFLRLLPALGELTMLGKIWYEWVARDATGRPRYDVVILDAPATGHARALLLAPSAVKASVPKGPMHDNAARIDAMLRQHNSELDFVTTAEDMPVTEVEELLAFAHGHGFAHCRVIANQVPELLPAGAHALAQRLASQPLPLAAAGQSLLRRQQRARAGHAALQRLTHGLQLRMPTFPHGTEPTRMLQQMGALLAEATQPLVQEGAA